MEILENLSTIENLDSFCDQMMDAYLEKSDNVLLNFDDNLKWITILQNGGVRQVLTSILIKYPELNESDPNGTSGFGRHISDVPKRLLLSAIASLQIYVLDNFLLNIEKFDIIKLFDDCKEFIDDFFDLEDGYLEISRLKYPLNVDGETFCPLARNLRFLKFSRIIFNYIFKLEPNSLINNTIEHFHLILWAMRSAIIHQLSLKSSTGTLHKEILKYVEKIETFLKQDDFKINDSFKMSIMMEIANIFLVFGDQENSKKFFFLSQQYSKITFNLIGKMGYRTNFQKYPVAQLMVDLKRSDEISDDFIDETQTTIKMPQNERSDDNTLLQEVEIVYDKSESEQPIEEIIKLRHVEQVLMMTSVKFKQKFGSTSDDLLKEELSTYIYFLLKYSDIWIMQFHLLEMRSILEMNESKRVERSLKQLETLLNVIQNPSGHLDEQATQRSRFFYPIFSSPFWRIQKHLADLRYSLGVYKAALNTYLELKQWDRVIDCYRKLGMMNEAEEMIKEKLKENDNQPELHCILGEITGNLDCFHYAWKISNEKFALAPKMLGYHYFKIQDYNQALDYFWKSIEVNTMQQDVWSWMGHIGLEQEDWDLAVKAYRNVLLFDQESFEAWNNLSKAYIKLGNKERAMKTLQEAYKNNFDQWMIWENYIAVCADLGEVNEVILAWNRLIDIKGYYLDDKIAEILIQCVQFEKRLFSKVLELFSRITITSPGTAKIWQNYARLLIMANRNDNDYDDSSKIEQFFQKSQRQILSSGWEKDANQIKKILDHFSSLLEDMKQFVEIKSPKNSTKLFQSFKLFLKPIFTQIENNLDKQSIVIDQETTEKIKFQMDSIKKELEEF